MAVENAPQRFRRALRPGAGRRESGIPPASNFASMPLAVNNICWPDAHCFGTAAGERSIRAVIHIADADRRMAGVVVKLDGSLGRKAEKPPAH